MNTMSNDIVKFDVKVQTIIYENSTGKIKRYYHTGNARLNLESAKEKLQSLGLTTDSIIRVITERATLKQDRETFTDSIINTERFYKN